VAIPYATSGIIVAEITGIAGYAINQFYSPRTLVVDQQKTMFIVDTWNHRILRWIIRYEYGSIMAETSTYGLLSNQL
jgi:hypothetical protein